VGMLEPLATRLVAVSGSVLSCGLWKFTAPAITLGRHQLRFKSVGHRLHLRTGCPRNNTLQKLAEQNEHEN
jgi:hypothetical protein